MIDPAAPVPIFCLNVSAAAAAADHGSHSLAVSRDRNTPAVAVFYAAGVGVVQTLEDGGNEYKPQTLNPLP